MAGYIDRRIAIDGFFGGECTLSILKVRYSILFLVQKRGKRHPLQLP